MRFLIAPVFFFLSISLCQAQLVTEKSLTSTGVGYGAKKMKKAPKKIFINQFFINYQVISSSSENSGVNKAQMAVGLEGLEVDDFQIVTNEAYEMVKSKFAEAGYEIVEPDEAARIETFTDWMRVDGGTPSKNQLLGYLSTAPLGYQFFIKGVTKKGKGKKTFFDVTPKISKELGDIPVFEANVNFQYVTIEGSTMINDAVKMKGKVDYVLPEVAVAQSSEGIFGSKVQTNRTMARVVWKGGAAGAGAASVVAFVPKKDIDIPGVMDEKKFKEYVQASPNYNNNPYASIVMTNTKDVNVSHIVKADREAFKQKTKQALEEYLSMVVEEFIASASGK